MTLALALIGGYVVVGGVVALALAYRCALDARLNGREPDWDEDGPIAAGLGLFWAPAAVVAAIAWTVRSIGRAIDSAATVEAEARRLDKGDEE